ncbi:MAG: glycoside hydrolase family 9 protein [Candidatus Cryptobacteroides sp.]|nr:glycoside hydrolase family 9 protein [Candidatus Cryptobacteroides sp.]CCX51667.1 cellulase [Alistipes sp. CAG:514]
MKRLVSMAILSLAAVQAFAGSWIRVNQIGYLPEATKVAVFMSDETAQINGFELVDAFTGEVAFSSSTVRPTGVLGRMKTTCRLDFSGLKTSGAYYIKVLSSGGETRSETFPVGAGVYDGAADFVLNYMRQQRCGWNPFFKDNCHRKDGIIVGHPDPRKDSTFLDVTGGWHDASDCLQYTTTSANAIYQMMFAYQSNPEAFSDNHLADGTPGRNGIPDIVDEIYWGLKWLDKMNPEPGEMYNQIADDRDHVGMRVPSDDQADYGWGKGGFRPVWYCSGEPQQRGRRGDRNKTTGVASTAGKFASDFALGAEILRPFYPEFAERIGAKAKAAYDAGVAKPGVCQTASVVSPYIYEEDNWVDDMELAAYEMFRRTGDGKYRTEAIEYARREPVTPWMGADSARHYQWYPFMNMGHYRIARNFGGKVSAEFIRNMRSGIQRVYERGKDHPFMFGIPGIWCSNNLTTAMLTQCILYRELTGDTTYQEMEGSLRDWLLGCNPWGVSMIVELPKGGTFPTQPHSFIIKYKMGNTTGGLVDGPVYSTIFGGLLGIHTDGGVNYEEFQPGDLVYHDSTHDYSTNEPTMDGTASLTFPLSYYQREGRELQNKVSGAAVLPDRNIYRDGGIIRTDPSVRHIDFVFTAADKADGADRIISTLRKYNIKGGFFFTGEFFELYPDVVRRLVAEGHYVGSHSYGHLLYAPWGKRDSLLVTRQEFEEDMFKSYKVLREFGITDAPYFIPPYEHYNATISSWARQLGLQVINYTPGTLTNGDYTTPGMSRYFSSKEILGKIREYERTDPDGLNGHIMLIHFGTDPSRTDKFYDKLPGLIRELRRKGYSFTPLKDNDQAHL